ncbi:dipeptide/oligopeptide/nickel ABC transporter permease/ATP-binding protein [Microbacterium sp. Marseille-Q6648]|uniref:dipeptide/oligopeptide/nickel ABC transporter permease/ATP-binding protein n=1 Tax=Microbacterium sp. Marseille-Q6648 TaxID=2937991 RepID=UPI00203E1A2D|nr:dipeptide/oligopeptide/nickel ABC transporter permease/ATP-binding protein [Microbacterium sp. Marseille-Q6648]
MTDTYSLNLSRLRRSPDGRPQSGLSRVIGRMRRQPLTLVALWTIVALALIAIFAPVIAPYDPNVSDYSALLQGPSATHWLGTDNLGQDYFSRLIFGTRVALVVALGSVLIAMALGVPIGLLLGYRGGWTDRLGSRLLDVAQALPGLLVALAVIAILGRSLWTLMLAIGLIFTMGFARVTRAIALTERHKLYVESAHVAGMRERTIIFRQVLPNLIGPLVIQAAVFFGSAIMIESGLSFLGLGLNRETPTWGGLLSMAVAHQAQQPFLAFPPGIAIIITVLAFNLFGDGMNDAITGGIRRSPRKAQGKAALPSMSNVPTAAAATLPGQDAPLGAQSPDDAAPDAASPFPSHRTPAPAPTGITADDRLPVATNQVLAVRELSVELERPEGDVVPLVSNAQLSIGAGEIVGLLGESGSGKSMFAKAVMGLLPPRTRLASGTILFDGTELAFQSQRMLRTVRGAGIGVVFQDPLSALSPVHTVGRQLVEPLREHKGMSRSQARDRAVELLERVGVSRARERLDHYPHQFSGGMAQRVAIAMALAADPKLLIADEATSALDVTTQAQVLDLILDLRDEYGMGVLMITHDLGVVAETCDRAAIMYAGQIIETGTVTDLFRTPRHPYTAALLAANPAADARVDRLPTIPGRVPLAGEWPRGCHFANRCVFATTECTLAPVPMIDEVRCVRAHELTLEVAAR